MADGGQLSVEAEVAASNHYWLAGLKAANAQKALATLPEAHRRPAMLGVLFRVSEGERTADIASELGISRVRLNQLLLQYAEDDWRSLQVARALTAKEKAEDLLETAPDGLTLARAREQLRAAQWDLERLLSRLYGQKQQVEHTSSPVINFVFTSTETHTPKQITVINQEQEADSQSGAA